MNNQKKYVIREYTVCKSFEVEVDEKEYKGGVTI